VVAQSVVRGPRRIAPKRGPPRHDAWWQPLPCAPSYPPWWMGSQLCGHCCWTTTCSHECLGAPTSTPELAPSPASYLYWALQGLHCPAGRSEGLASLSVSAPSFHPPASSTSFEALAHADLVIAPSVVDVVAAEVAITPPPPLHSSAGLEVVLPTPLLMSPVRSLADVPMLREASLLVTPRGVRSPISARLVPLTAVFDRIRSPVSTFHPLHDVMLDLFFMLKTHE
jgi:hypothetical protein